MVEKVEKSIPWVIILVICIAVFFGILIILKEEITADTGTASVYVLPYDATVGLVLLNGGDDITLVENTTTLVSATATVSDPDGHSDITSIIGKIYRSGVGTTCSADNNNCYEDSACATSSCSGLSCVATCECDVWFYAEPTDTGSPWSSEYWEAWIKAIDSSNASSSATSSGVEMNTLNALGVSSLQESHTTGDDGAASAYNSRWIAQGFTIGTTRQNRDHYITGIRVKLYRVGSPETFTVGIQLNAGEAGNDLTNGSIDGNTLTTSTAGAWYTIPVTPYALSSSTQYFMVARAPSGDSSNRVYWRWSPDSYSGGEFLGNNNSGSGLWSAPFPGHDLLFETYGEGGVIDYGTLFPGDNSSSTNQPVIIIDTGNAAIDIYLYGENMDKN